jgi:hypothetical protein
MTQYDRREGEGAELESLGSGPSLVLGTAAGAAVGAVLGAVAGAAVTKMFMADFRGGDEAPIRVRHGSPMRIELFGRPGEFEDVGKNKKWRIRGNPRGKDYYLVIAVPQDPTTCPDGVIAVGQEVTFTYNEANTKPVYISARDRRTLIANDDGLTKRTPRELNYGNTGYITEVRVDGYSLYSNVKYDRTLHFVLLDM